MIHFFQEQSLTLSPDTGTLTLVIVPVLEFSYHKTPSLLHQRKEGNTKQVST